MGATCLTLPMQQVIGSISHSVPTVLREVITLGRTLERRAVDVLAYFDQPGTSNGPTEAINGRLDISAAQPPASATSPVAGQRQVRTGRTSPESDSSGRFASTGLPE
jgi:hypothetical protein